MPDQNGRYMSKLDAQSAFLLLVLSKSTQPLSLRELLITADVLQQAHEGDVRAVLQSVQAAANPVLRGVSEFELFALPRVQPGGTIPDVPLAAVALQRLREEGLIELSRGISEHSLASLTERGRELAATIEAGPGKGASQELDGRSQ